MVRDSGWMMMMVMMTDGDSDDDGSHDDDGDDDDGGDDGGGDDGDDDDDGDDGGDDGGDDSPTSDKYLSPSVGGLSSVYHNLNRPLGPSFLTRSSSISRTKISRSVYKGKKSINQ